MGPERLDAYSNKWGRRSLLHFSRWPAAILTWMPLSIPCLALGLGDLPSGASSAPDAMLFRGICGVLAFAVILTGWSYSRDLDWKLAATLVVAVALAIVVALLIGISLAGGVAVSIAFPIAFIVAIGVAGAISSGVMDAKGVLPNFSTAGAAASVMASGVAGGAAGGVASGMFFVAIGLVGIPVGIVVSFLMIRLAGGFVSRAEHIVFRKRRSWLTLGSLGALVLAYWFLIWFSFLDGWQVFVNEVIVP